MLSKVEWVEVKKKSTMSQGEGKEMKYTLAFHAEGKKSLDNVDKVTCSA